MNYQASSERTKLLERLNRLAQLLDSSIPLGTGGYRIGIDPILGLIPGIGDAIGAFVGIYIVLQGARLGASRLTLVPMMLNLTIDSVLGVVPVLGDIFDFAFKSNQRNLALLRDANLDSYDQNAQSRLGSALISTTLIVAIFSIAIIFGVFYLAVRVLSHLG